MAYGLRWPVLLNAISTPSEMMPYYRWPNGMFENLGGPWLVMKYRPMPSTPAGDVVAEFPSKEIADAVADEFNRYSPDLEEARSLFL